MATFYIATRLARADDHNFIRDALLADGHRITYDWTVHGSVKEISTTRLTEVADLEVEGVLAADFVILLLPGGRGTHTELGLAIASKIRTLVHSAARDPFLTGDQTCAFYHHPLVTRLTCPLADLPTHAIPFATLTCSA